MVGMPYGRFIGLSLLGSAHWLAALIVLGYAIGDNAQLIKTYIGSITAFLLLLVTVLWFVRHMRKRSKKDPAMSQK